MNKKHFLWIIVAVVLIGLIILLGNNFIQTKDPVSDYNSTRTTQNISVNEGKNDLDNQSTESNIENSEPNSDKTNESENVEINADNSTSSENKSDNKEASKQSKETEIASFTTKIYSKDKGRQKNLTLACSALNDTTVENGKTFSFSRTVGKATSSKGYKKADVFKNGDVIEALGGGLCQVSTTLYNAILKVPNAKVTERHSHSNKVPYIKSGKDAAVSYGTYDFKFVNNTGSPLKIKASNTPNNVTIKILKLE